MESLIVLALLSLGLIPKSLLERVYFHDTASSLRTLLLWGVSTASLLCSFALSLLFNHFI